MKPHLIGGSAALATAMSLAFVLMAPACKKPATAPAATTTSTPAGAATITTTTTRTTSKAKPADPALPPEVTHGNGKVADRSAREALDKPLATAQAAFAKRDLAAAFQALDEVPPQFRTDPAYLNLRGACHVEKRDFDPALADFQAAAKQRPGDPSIRFNVAEMHFVKHQWDDAIKAFDALRVQSPVESFSELVHFKLMLCEEGRGNHPEYDRRAADNLKAPDTLLALYTKAAMEYRANDPAAAEATLTDAATLFPKPADRAPWHDTMVEFGYLGK